MSPENMKIYNKLFIDFCEEAIKPNIVNGKDMRIPTIAVDKLVDESMNKARQEGYRQGVADGMSAIKSLDGQQ